MVSNILTVKIPSFITDIEGWDQIPSFMKILKDEINLHNLQRYLRMRHNTIIYKDFDGWDKMPLFINGVLGWHKTPSFIKISKDEINIHHLSRY